MDPRFDAITPKLTFGFKKLEPIAKYTYRQARLQMRIHRRYSRWQERWMFGFWAYTGR
jgi:hypothetical protein